MAFPDHGFDFGELVLVLPTQLTGSITGIRQGQNNTWFYLVSSSDQWWLEDELMLVEHTNAVQS